MEILQTSEGNKMREEVTEMFTRYGFEMSWLETLPHSTFGSEILQIFQTEFLTPRNVYAHCNS